MTSGSSQVGLERRKKRVHCSVKDAVARCQRAADMTETATPGAEPVRGSVASTPPR